MRPLTILGILLILGGGVVLIRGLNMTTKREVADVGPIQVTTTETKSVPSWIGAIAAVAGVALVLAGSGKK
ncbi:MAG: DUF3185 domain-containing protein [Gemmatimonadales bacterium]